VKAGGRVRYWIQYRLPGGKQRKEYVGTSIEQARDAQGKRRAQKREGKIFDIKLDSKLTFQELTDWYLSLEKVKELASYRVLTVYLKKFNAHFGSMIVSKAMPIDIENHQIRRKKEGNQDASIDREIGAVRTMVFKAFDNNMIGGDTLRVFKSIKKMLRRNANARDRILTPDEYQRLMGNAPCYLKDVIAMGYYTGMRKSEILNLTWNKVDLKKRVIRLEAQDTKDKEPRLIPICDELYERLKAIPKALHDSHVFLYQGNRLMDIKRAFINTCEKAEILYGRTKKGGLSFHDLRHTFNTNMRKAGVPESVIMKVTGHSTREMFDRYDSVDVEDARQAIKKMELFLESVTHIVTHEENQKT